MAEREPTTVQVWTLEVRLIHWTLAAAVATAWLAEAGEALHERAGYLVLGLVGLRLVLGFVGARHARFRDFVRGPRAVLAAAGELLRGRPSPHLGHNPLGAVMIVALLAGLAVAAGSGALMVTDRFWGDPRVEALHETSSSLVVLLVPLHLAGVLVSSLLERQNLVLAMITGRKRWPPRALEAVAEPPVAPPRRPAAAAREP